MEYSYRRAWDKVHPDNWGFNLEFLYASAALILNVDVSPVPVGHGASTITALQ